MKSKICKGCRNYHPIGSTQYTFDVCNFMNTAKRIQALEACPNGKPEYVSIKEYKLNTVLDFIEKVREMRSAQREFKEHLTYGYRNLAITLEKEVDEMLEEMDHES